MRVSIYAGLVISPISFPDELKVLIFPLNRKTNRPLGGNFPMIEHHTLEWVRNQYPLNKEDARGLSFGERINVFTGYLVAEFRANVVFPEGTIMERLD
jgi:hypothetical protein